MTNAWTDIRTAGLVIVMGGNAAEAHPCGFKWVVEAKAHRGARLIVVDPRYNRTASVSDAHAPIRQGSDIAFLLGAVKWCIDNDKVQWDYVRNQTNAVLVVKEGFALQDGLFTGYNEEKRDYGRSSWDYDIGPYGFAVEDRTLQNPRCVWNLLKAHIAVYTPEMAERICGTPKDMFLKIAAMIGETSAKDTAMTSLYALGWTHHSKGAQNIRGIAMLQLILGNIGIRGGGMNALRGHSNIQGLTDVGLLSNSLPGYMNLPTDKKPGLPAYLGTRTFKLLKPNQVSYWQNYPKFFVSLKKSLWGPAATADNGFACNYLPKLATNPPVAPDTPRQFGPEDRTRISATDAPTPARQLELVAKLIDISKCIGCKACQSACLEWNDRHEDVGISDGSYTHPPDLTSESWTLMRFTEWVEPETDAFSWLIRKDGCMHCADPGYLKACLAPGAIVQYSNGIVDFIHDKCIGCGYCIKGCPFDIPRISKVDHKAHKCSLCSDRVAVGPGPACAKACPTVAITFGTKVEMTALASERIDDLKSRGYDTAALCDPQGVGGTHVMYVLPHGKTPWI
jgi:formate dehydrogenase beta subunit